MTKRFAEELKAKYHCSACSDPHAPAKKFCTRHLALARAAWHRHATKCGREGRCINCARKKLPEEQRCPTCKERNRSHCRAWGAAHVEERKTRRRTLLAAGLCEACGKRPRIGDHVRCSTCYPKGYRS